MLEPARGGRRVPLGRVAWAGLFFLCRSPAQLVRRRPGRRSGEASAGAAARHRSRLGGAACVRARAGDGARLVARAGGRRGLSGREAAAAGAGVPAQALTARLVPRPLQPARRAAAVGGGHGEEVALSPCSSGQREGWADPAVSPPGLVRGTCPPSRREPAD